VAATEVEICNVALLRVGQGQTLDSLEEASAEARACKVLYAQSRDAVLSEARWGFAVRRATMASIPETRDGWLYAYALPSDCLTVLRVTGHTRNLPNDLREPFALEYEPAHGRVLLADREDAEVVYVAQVLDVPRYPPLFVDALAWKLAAELALCLPVKPQVAAMMVQGYRASLENAVASEYRQAQEDEPPRSIFIRGR
jgi:hypothetical protein